MLLHGGVAEDTREGRDLVTLMRVCAALSSVHGLAAIDAALAGFVLDVVPAERVVLAGGDRGPSEVRSAWSAATGSTAAVAIDSELLDRVAKDGTAMMIHVNGRDAVVAPMMAFGRATGTVWAEIRRGAGVDAGHVRLLLVVDGAGRGRPRAVLESARLQADNELLKAEINLDHNMVGRSRPMRALFDRIARVARTDSTMLLRGESGTGKELVARAAHRNSSRADRPFIADQLRRDHRVAARVGAVRPREGRVHRRRRTARKASWSWPTAARCSSTRSASCRSRCRRSCCARCRSASSSASAARGRYASTSG